MTKMLTKREREVFALIKEGFSDKEVAEKLGISQYTTSTHVRNICRKVNVKKRTHAIARLLVL